MKIYLGNFLSESLPDQAIGILFLNHINRLRILIFCWIASFAMDRIKWIGDGPADDKECRI